MPFPDTRPVTSTDLAARCEFNLDKAGQLLKESGVTKMEATWHRLHAGVPARLGRAGPDHAGGLQEDRLHPQPAGSAAGRRRAPSCSAKTTRWRCITYGRAAKDPVTMFGGAVVWLPDCDKNITPASVPTSTRSWSTRPPSTHRSRESEAGPAPAHRVRAGPALTLPCAPGFIGYLKKRTCRVSGRSSTACPSRRRPGWPN